MTETWILPTRAWGGPGGGLVGGLELSLGNSHMDALSLPFGLSEKWCGAPESAIHTVGACLLYTYCVLSAALATATVAG